MVSKKKMFENVDRRRTDNGVTGILLAHPCAFGSGELKSAVIAELFMTNDATNNDLVSSV